MEASGGGGRSDHIIRSRREPLGLHNGAAALFHQTLTEPGDVDRAPTNNNNTAAANSSSSNPDPVSFAFAAASSPGPPSMTSPPTSSGKPKPGVRYRECRRNHAASVGGSVLDGCGEFMPAGEDGTIEALRCAACDCHRNFHRRESDADPSPLAASGGGYRRGGGMSLAPLQLPAPPQPPVIHHHHGHGGSGRPPPPYASLSIVPPMSVAFGGGGGTESSSEDLNLFGTTTPTGHGHHHLPSGGGGGYFGSSSSKSSKRFRTKFSQDQKERMMEFAERIGWRIQRQSEDEVERFCAEVGVKRQVFKVWMHNNKNGTKSSNKQLTPTADLEPDNHDNHHHRTEEH